MIINTGRNNFNHDWLHNPSAYWPAPECHMQPSLLPHNPSFDLPEQDLVKQSSLPSHEQLSFPSQSPSSSNWAHIVSVSPNKRLKIEDPALFERAIINIDIKAAIAPFFMFQMETDCLFCPICVWRSRIVFGKCQLFKVLCLESDDYRYK